MKIRIGTTENESRFHHYAAVMESEEIEWIGTISPPFDESTLGTIDAFICSCEHHWPTRLAITACKRLGIPTFHVLDGIVEWRNLFENPRSSVPENGAPLFQPLLSDLTFAMGSAQEWALRWLGNERVAATGLPRLDCIPRHPCRTGQANGHKRLMVATANTPWFTDDQQLRFLEEFGALKRGLVDEELEVDVLWRVADPVREALNLPISSVESLRESLSRVDAVVTTPSTLAVEAMQMGIPTMVFDPYRCPILTPSAWWAGSAVDVLTQLPALLAPDAMRSSLQNALAQLASPQSGATERVRQRILRMTKGVAACTDAKERRVEKSSQGSVAPISAPGAWLCRLSPSEIQGIAATVPSLERKLYAKEQELKRLFEERQKPSLRHAVGCVSRWLFKSIH